MMFDLPEDKILYQALCDRDPAWEGRAFVCVHTTGIFCRLSCPARNPKPENCSFVETIGECIEAGYRPCKRCHPMGTAAEHDPAVKDLLAKLEADPAYRWREADIVALGYDSSTIRRSFRRHFGMTFLEMARQTRLRNGFQTLSNNKVIEAQLDAGYDSPSAFRTAFAKLMGVAPSAFQKDALLRADWIDTPLGAMIAVADQTALHLLEFSDRKALPGELKKLHAAVKGEIGIGRTPVVDMLTAQLSEYFNGKRRDFTIPLAAHGSPFSREVWHHLRQIPAGETRSYGDLARAIGRPTATRAVARANGANQIAILIPCHRVIGADGTLTGYGGGLWRKQKLIEIEQKLREAQTI